MSTEHEVEIQAERGPTELRDSGSDLRRPAIHLVGRVIRYAGGKEERRVLEELGSAPGNELFVRKGAHSKSPKSIEPFDPGSAPS
jgi:hypothetical protein